MSGFDSFSSKALGITQGFFGEQSTYSQDEQDLTIKAVYQTVTIEVNGLLSEGLSAEVVESDLSGVVPNKGDTLTRGTKLYRIDSAALNSGVYVLILKD